LLKLKAYMNPFQINKYIGPAYFCDRETETKTLIANIQQQNNTAFFAQRRMGKSALIRHVFHQLKKKGSTTIYMDIYATQSLKDFTNQLANAIYNVFPNESGIGKRFWNAIKLLRPVISIDSISGVPELTLDITQSKQFEKTIPQLLQFIDRQNVKTVIAIDEFQQILNYNEKNVEALLRTVIQTLKHVSFVFCGSNHKMMHAIFNSSKRPFYASTKNLHISKIKEDIYAAFIQDHFKRNKMSCNYDSTHLILELTHSHTYYTQRLCHEIFNEGKKVISEEVVFKTLNKILLENENTYYQFRQLITPLQWKLLKAIAIEERVIQIFSQTFLQKHLLGSASNVKRGINALLEKELVYYEVSKENTHYEVSDKFLMHWIKNK
jgi:uncharacterized protein